jgi:hypothetical protein
VNHNTNILRLAICLIGALGAHATHKPGDFPSPPWPPGAHIETVVEDGSTANGNVSAVSGYEVGPKNAAVHLDAGLKFSGQLDWVLIRADGTVERST